MEQMLNLNSKVLHHNYYTDVITFCEKHKKFIDVEMYICLDFIRDHYSDKQIELDREYIRTFFHGLLHCAGFDDDNPESISLMRAKEKLLCDVYFSKFHVKH